MSNGVTYVGERYIPKFDGMWTNEKLYEPLTIVSYEGNSYISKSHIPVGVSVTNENYWLKCGEFNPQIQDYMVEVQNLHGDLEKLLSKLRFINTDVGVNLNMTHGSVHCERYGAVVVCQLSVNLYPNDGTENQVFVKPNQSYLITRIPFEYRPTDFIREYVRLLSGQVCELYLDTTGSTSGEISIKIIDESYPGNGLPCDDISKYKLVHTMCWIVDPNRPFSI